VQLLHHNGQVIKRGHVGHVGAAAGRVATAPMQHAPAHLCEPAPGACELETVPAPGAEAENILGGVGRSPNGPVDGVGTGPRLEGVHEAVAKEWKPHRIDTPDQAPCDGGSHVHSDVVLVQEATPAAGAGPVRHLQAPLHQKPSMRKPRTPTPSYRGVVFAGPILEAKVCRAAAARWVIACLPACSALAHAAYLFAASGLACCRGSGAPRRRWLEQRPGPWKSR
jgi:hypothetical protein